MAKGLAVVSGSNNVVFKVLETGVMQAGSATTAATFTITGSLLLSGAAEPVLQLEGLTLVATSSVASDTILIKSGSFVKEASYLSGNQVVLADGTDIETKINSLETNLGAQTLTVTGSDGSYTIDLESDQLEIVGTANEVDVSLSDNGGTTTFQVGLPSAVTITDSLTVTGGSGEKLVLSSGDLSIQSGDISGSGDLSVGGALTGSVARLTGAGDALVLEQGNLVLSSGNISGSGKLEVGGDITGSSNLKVLGSGNIDGDLTVGGNLTVQGDVTVLETQNLRVEDPIIILGSSSSPQDGDRGLVFQRSGSDNRAFLWDDDSDKFILGSTSDDGTGTSLTVDAGTAAKSTLVLHTLEAVDVSASNATLTGDVTLGDAGTDRLTINSYITGSGNIVVSSSLTIGDAGNVDNETTTFVSKVRMPVFSVSGANAVAGYPQVPADYAATATSYSGHSFYLTSSDGSNHTGDDSWAQGNKWYFNERGVWHSSFFFSE